MNDEAIMTSPEGFRQWVAGALAEGERDQTQAPYYFAPGDELFLFWDRARNFAERIDDALTVFRSIEDPKKLVGFVAKDVKRRLAIRDPEQISCNRPNDFSLLVILQSVRMSVNSDFTQNATPERRDATYQQVCDNVVGVPPPAELFTAIG